MSNNRKAILIFIVKRIGMALIERRGIFMDLKNMISGTDIRGIVSKYEDKDINLSEKEVEFIA